MKQFERDLQILLHITSPNGFYASFKQVINFVKSYTFLLILVLIPESHILDSTARARVIFHPSSAKSEKGGDGKAAQIRILAG